MRAHNDMLYCARSKVGPWMIIGLLDKNLFWSVLQRWQLDFFQWKWKWGTSSRSSDITNPRWDPDLILFHLNFMEQCWLRPLMMLCCIRRLQMLIGLPPNCLTLKLFGPLFDKFQYCHRNCHRNWCVTAWVEFVDQTHQLLLFYPLESCIHAYMHK